MSELNNVRKKTESIIIIIWIDFTTCFVCYTFKTPSVKNDAYEASDEW